MAVSKEEFNRWVENGREKGATHMISVCDTFDWDDYPVYVLPTDDLDVVKSRFNNVNIKNLGEILNILKLILQLKNSSNLTKYLNIYSILVFIKKSYIILYDNYDRDYDNYDRDYDNY